MNVQVSAANLIGLLLCNKFRAYVTATAGCMTRMKYIKGMGVI